jgi:hypothetical protein
VKRNLGLFALVVVVIGTVACGSAMPTGGPVSVSPIAVQGGQANTQVVITPTSKLPITTEAHYTATIIPSTVTTTNVLAWPPTSLPDLEILCFQDYEKSGYHHIVGEVRNNTHTPMGFVKIVVTLYKESNLTGIVYTYALLDVIPPVGKSPFDLVTDQYAGTTKYFIQVEGKAASLGRQDLVISNDKSSEEGSYLHIKGVVENKGSIDATYVKVVYTLYDRWGNVIGAGFTYTTLDTVPAGGSSPFDAVTDYASNFDHYLLKVQGE